MDAPTLAALEASVEKWRRNSEAQSADDYLVKILDCPLCRLFHDRSTGRGCVGCPVSAWTGRPICEDTPYERAYRLQIQWSKGADVGPEARASALDEMEFLQSLLPKESNPHG